MACLTPPMRRISVEVPAISYRADPLQRRKGVSLAPENPTASTISGPMASRGLVAESSALKELGDSLAGRVRPRWSLIRIRGDVLPSPTAVVFGLETTTATVTMEKESTGVWFQGDAGKRWRRCCARRIHLDQRYVETREVICTTKYRDLRRDPSAEGRGGVEDRSKHDITRPVTRTYKPTIQLSVIPGCSLDRSSRVVGPTASYYTNCLKRQLSMGAANKMAWQWMFDRFNHHWSRLAGSVGLENLNKRSQGPSHGWTWALCPFKSVGSLEGDVTGVDDFRVPSETRFIRRHGHAWLRARIVGNSNGESLESVVTASAREKWSRVRHSARTGFIEGDDPAGLSTVVQTSKTPISSPVTGPGTASGT
ncbi:hypothetical protein HD554DRAFT_2037197 [Boletus coccyginus]|nr:hypothetical protein HD554DRAFT_2037197 [Boletus coccyginus]